jgi:Transcriptional activator TraM
MSDKMNEVIQDVAVKHGVALGKDDPILILQTMNERLLEENRKAQKEMLAQFKEEMENISSQWKVDAKEKSEKVLNSALNSSKEVMARFIHTFENESIYSFKKLISDSLLKAHELEQRERKISWIALMFSMSSLILSLLFVFYNLE